jgi:hypothetical protein
LSEQQGPLVKSAIVSVVLQLIVAYLVKSNPSLASMLGTVGTPTMAGIAGLLFSLWAKGSSTGTAVAGGALSGVGAGLVTSLLGGLLGGGGVNLGALGGRLSRRVPVASWARAIGSPTLAGGTDACPTPPWRSNPYPEQPGGEPRLRSGRARSEAAG